MSTTKTSYQVSPYGHNNSGYLSPDGYTKYNERLKLYYDGKLPEGEEVYGLEQAIDHVAEYFGTKDEYIEYRKKHRDTLVISKVTTIIEDIPFKMPDPIPNIGKYVKKGRFDPTKNFTIGTPVIVPKPTKEELIDFSVTHDHWKTSFIGTVDRYSCGCFVVKNNEDTTKEVYIHPDRLELFY